MPEGASRATHADSAPQARSSLADCIFNKVADDSVRPEGASRHTTAHSKVRTSRAGRLHGITTTECTLHVSMNGVG